MRSFYVVVAAGLVVVGGPLATTVPFKVSTGRPMVELTVNGEGPYPFVLDTGAPGLIVRPELVEELGLEVVGTTEVNSPLGGTPVEARQVHVGSIDLGGAPVTDLEALVLDHLDRGGDACIFEEGALRLCAGGTRKDIATAGEVPALLGGAARRPLASALRGLGAAVALGLGLEQARAGLERLRGPRYIRREGVQVLAEQIEDTGATLESVRTLVELPAERRLLWRQPGELDGAVDELASAAGVEIVDGIALSGLLHETRAGDALLVLTGPEPGTVTAELDCYEADTALGG